MRAFIDTCALVKKYIQESGSDKMILLLNNISEIVISPTCLLEIASALNRRVKEKTLTPHQAGWVESQLKLDCRYFSKVVWNESLEEKGIELIRKYQIKTLDCVQLASACISQTDKFITSDKILAEIARKEIKVVELI